MAYQHGRHSEMITQLLRHVKASPHDGYVKEVICIHTIYSPSLVAIVFKFLELPSPQSYKTKKDGLNRVNKGNSMDIINPESSVLRLEERTKPEYPEKTSLGERRETIKISTHSRVISNPSLNKTV